MARLFYVSLIIAYFGRVDACMATTSTTVTTTTGAITTTTVVTTTTKEKDCREHGCREHECCQKVCNKGSYYAWWCRFECVTCKHHYQKVYDNVYEEKKVVVVEKPVVYKEVYGQTYGQVYGQVYPGSHEAKHS